MAIDIEQRIMYLNDADGNTMFVEVRQYEQFKTLVGVTHDKRQFSFTFEGLDDSNRQTWSTVIDDTEWNGVFNSVVEITNSGKFDDIISKPKTTRLDTF